MSQRWNATAKAEAIEAIVAKLRDGDSVRKACEAVRPDPVPDSTWERWLGQDPNLVARYERARADGADWIVEEAQRIALDTAVEPQRARNLIDIIKWKLARQHPKKYGDRQKIEHSGGLTLEQIVAGSRKPEGADG